MDRNVQDEPSAALSDAGIDDNAVDAFATAMKTKLAQKRAEGRGGWHDPKQCSITYLEKLLHEHYRKGDVLDLANFCMMLHQREGRPTRWRLTEPQEFAMAQVCLDMHDALGVKWGDDPYPIIAQAKRANALAAEVERLRLNNLKSIVAAEREIESAEQRADKAVAALQISRTALNDWIVTYAEEESSLERVAEARERINEYGLLAYIADVQKQNREAIKECDK
jgi:hypothetical protein